MAELTLLADERARRVAKELSDGGPRGDSPAALGASSDALAARQEHLDDHPNRESAKRGPINIGLAQGALLVTGLMMLKSASSAGFGVLREMQMQQHASSGSLPGLRVSEQDRQQPRPTGDARTILPDEGRSGSMKIPSMAAVVTTAATMIAAGAGGTDIRVPQDIATIQGAIDAAGAGDRVLVAPGTYRENLDLSGKQITIEGLEGANATTIDGGGTGPVVTGSGEPIGASLRGFTIRNGFSNDRGGGLTLSNSALRISSCIIRDNRADYWWAGGGLWTANGAVVVEDCAFIGNKGSSDPSAAAVYKFMGGSFRLSRCTFDSNISQASGTDPGWGGRVIVVNPEFNSVDAIIEDCVFANHLAGCTNPGQWGEIVLHATRGQPVKIRGCRFIGTAIAQRFMVWVEAGSSAEIYGVTGCGQYTDAIWSAPNDGTWTIASSSFSANCTDCNNNGTPDAVEIMRGTAQDSNSNWQIDVCECTTNPALPFCCSSDLNADGRVDGADLAAVLAFWGPTGAIFPRADINHDGTVDGFDLGILLAHWGPCGP